MCYSAMVKRDLQVFKKIFGPFWVRESEISEYETLHALNPKKYPALRERIFVGSFAPVLFSYKSRFHLRYMRFGAYETNDISTYNARCENLESKYWQPLLRENRGIVLLTSFFEWVSHSQEKKISLKFFSESNSILFAPVLFETGFALITREPTADILESGHDRSPAFLQEQDAIHWLLSKNSELNYWKGVLGNKQEFKWQIERDLEKSPEKNFLF
jgi:putative SOS response-associated peptidase YedK